MLRPGRVQTEARSAFRIFSVDPLDEEKIAGMQHESRRPGLDWSAPSSTVHAFGGFSGNLDVLVAF